MSEAPLSDAGPVKSAPEGSAGPLSLPAPDMAHRPLPEADHGHGHGRNRREPRPLQDSWDGLALPTA